MYNIKQLASEFEITARTLRHYEDIGILKPGRSGNNRIFTNQDKTRLEFTLKARELGFSLSELAELFELYDDSQAEETQLFRFMHLLRTKKRELDLKQKELQKIRQQIEDFEAQCLQHIKDKGLFS